MWFEEFSKHIRWHPGHETAIKRAWRYRCAERLRQMLRNVRKSDERPLWLPEIYYKELCVYWKSPEFLKLSQSGKKNRVEGMGGQGAGKSTCGSVSILEHEERLRAQLGDKFTVYDLCKRGHQIQTGQKKGEWADSRAQKFSEAFESLKEKATQQSNETGQPAPDDVSLMLQVEGLKKGHAYGLGSMSQRLRGASTSVGGSIEMPLSSTQVASLTKTIEKKIKGKFDKKLKKIIEMQKQILELSNVRVPVDFGLLDSDDDSHDDDGDESMDDLDDTIAADNYRL